jgi:hypothetical protein
MRAFSFTDFKDPNNIEETALRERKAIIKFWDDSAKIEFIRDMIAMANSARTFGEAGYIILGIKDDGEICGIAEMISQVKIDGVCEMNVMEELRKQLNLPIENYVKPSLFFEFKTGDVDGFKVAFIHIPPQYNDQPFQVKKKYRRKDRGIEIGQRWVRFGEHKLEIKPQEFSHNKEPWCYSASQVPFIRGDSWLEYFQNRLALIKMYGEIQGYQELIVDKCDPDFGDEAPLNYLVEGFLERKIESFARKSLLWIEGDAGIGKSVALYRLAQKYIEQNIVSLQSELKYSQFVQPITYIPIFFSLRNYRVLESRNLAHELICSINKTGSMFTPNVTVKMPEKLFLSASLQWLILFDGFDEIYSNNERKKFIGQLKQFTSDYPRCTIIITSRPICHNFLNDDLKLLAIHFHLSPFKIPQIEHYISSRINSADDTFEDAIRFISSSEEIQKLCSYPAYLEVGVIELIDIYQAPQDPGHENIQTVQTSTLPAPASIERISGTSLDNINEGLYFERDVPTETVNDFDQYIEYEEPLKRPIMVGTFLDRIYCHLWDRESKRRGEDISTINQFWASTGRLACETLDWQYMMDEFVRRRLGKQGLIWILGLGVIKNKELAVYSFFTRLTYLYFFATRLKVLCLSKNKSKKLKCIESLSKEDKAEFFDIAYSIIPSALGKQGEDYEQFFSRRY